MRAFVQEVSSSPHVVVLKIRLVGELEGEGPRTRLLVVTPDGVGFVTSDERRAAWGAKLPPGAERQRAREDALANATVLAVTEREVFLDQRGEARVLRAERGRVVVTDGAPPPGAGWTERSGLALVLAVARGAIELHRAEVERALDRAHAKIARRRDAIRGDLSKIAEADAIAAQAQWLIAEAGRAPRGATELVVTDWSTGEAVPLRVRLDPAKPAKEQVASMFKRAKRLRLGARIAEDRLAQAEAQAAAVTAAREAVQVAASIAAIDEALAEAKRRAPRDVAGAPAATAARRKDTPARTPYRAFLARSGRRLLVGKGAADNDALTRHVARPHDLWLHAKDRTGAHVVAVLDRGQTCPAEDLVDAAHLAAHFSEARDEAVVDVQYAERRHLRKPKGSPAGFVRVDREKVLVLRVLPERVRVLIEREVLD